jgi:hypothetical protein
MMEKMEVRVPASHAGVLLGSVTSALFAFGAVVSPAVTLRAVPGDLSPGTVAGVIGGQLIVLALVAIMCFRVVRRAVHQQPKE